MPPIGGGRRPTEARGWRVWWRRPSRARAGAAAAVWWEGWHGGGSGAQGTAGHGAGPAVVHAAGGAARSADAGTALRAVGLADTCGAPAWPWGSRALARGPEAKSGAGGPSRSGRGRMRGRGSRGRDLDAAAGPQLRGSRSAIAARARTMIRLAVASWQPRSRAISRCVWPAARRRRARRWRRFRRASTRAAASTARVCGEGPGCGWRSSRSSRSRRVSRRSLRSESHFAAGRSSRARLATCSV